MIRVIPDLPSGIIGFEVSQEVTAADYRQILDPLIEEAVARGGKVRALAVLGPELRGYKVGAMLEDARVGLARWSSWERIALVTDDDHLREAVQLLGWMLPGDVAVFPTDERAAAIAWLDR